MRLGPVGAERPVVRDEAGVLYELSGLTADIDGAFLAAGGLGAAARAAAAGELPVLDDPGDGSGLRVGAPIARPTAVICIGMNYAAHAAESGSEPPTRPVIFFKHPNTVVGPYDEVLLPPGSTKTDWEVELAVVIGTRTRYLSSPVRRSGARRRIRRLERRIGTRVPDRDLGRAVEQGQERRDLQPGRTVARAHLGGRRRLRPRAALLRQRGAAAGFDDLRPHLQRRAHRLRTQPVHGARARATSSTRGRPRASRSAGASRTSARGT